MFEMTSVFVGVGSSRRMVTIVHRKMDYLEPIAALYRQARGVSDWVCVWRSVCGWEGGCLLDSSGCLVAWLVGWVRGWLVAWLLGCLVAWLVGWLAAWLLGCWVGCLVARLLGGLVRELVWWLASWLGNVAGRLGDMVGWLLCLLVSFVG